jgi:hypothetical protein
MRRIIEGTAYDTETSEKIKYSPEDEFEEAATTLYRTRHGAFFFHHRYLQPGWPDPHDFTEVETLVPCEDNVAQKWLEERANELVEQYFGQMPEGGSAERRLTLRMPNNLAKRLEEIAKSKELPLSRYINRCLERCAAEDGKPAAVL